jgi:hypothetical protein
VLLTEREREVTEELINAFKRMSGRENLLEGPGGGAA